MPILKILLCLLFLRKSRKNVMISRLKANGQGQFLLPKLDFLNSGRIDN
jgi:hypothetical protein